MATYVFNTFKHKIMTGAIDLDTSGDTIKAMLVMTNSTLLTATTDNSGTEAQKLEFRDDITTVDEFDGTGMTAEGETLLGTSMATTVDNTADNEGVFDADDVAFGTLVAGTRDIAGCFIYKSTGAAATDIPICFLDFADYDPGAGTDVTLQFSAEGIINIT